METESDTPIRFGMVGGGEGAFIGKAHCRAAMLDHHFTLCCGALSRDPDNNRRSGAALGLPASRVYDTWETMLAREAELPADQRAAAIVIATPNHLHVPIASAAIQKGFHVMCEKPAGVSLDETMALGRLLETSDRVYALTYTYNGYPMVHQARALVADGRIGAVRKIHVEYPQGWLADEPEARGVKQAVWRTQPSTAGKSGCLADIGTHAFSLAEFITGHRVAEVCAALGTHGAQRSLDDDGDILLRTEQGATGTLIASQICAGEENALKIRVYGDLGGIEWRQMVPSTLLYRRRGEPALFYRSGLDQPGLYPAARERIRLPGGHPEGYFEAMANLYADFASAIRAGRREVPGLLGGVEGRRGMAFIEAALTSHSQGSQWTALRHV